MAGPADPAGDTATQALREAIAALQAQRGLLGDAVADAALAPLQARLAQLQRPRTTAHPAAHHAAQQQEQPQQQAAGAVAMPAEQQLRQVSVLFIDVAGSTALSQHLDPEELHALLDGGLRRYTAVVQRHGGTVLQYAGDSLLAAFGTPPAREDDAERAVLAALGVLDEARQQSAEVLARHGHAGYTVRAGIATGAVLLGGGIEGMGSIRGMVVNVAARMEQTAPPGGLRICPDTHRLVRGMFELQAQPPLTVKGVDAPLATWLVQGRRSGAPAQATRGVGGVHSPLVGREAELATLRRTWQAQRNAEEAASHVTVVMGEAGIGKTRLATELRSWALARAPQTRWLDAQASERGAGRPYGVLRQLFTRHLGILDSHTPADARHAWLLAMRGLLGDEGDAAVLGQLLGFDFAAHRAVHALVADGQGRQLRDRAFFHATQALQAIGGSDGPLTVFIDDLHWADGGTLDFIDHALARNPRLMMLLCSSRPTLDERHAAWTGRSGRLCLTLAPLAGHDAATLADALLARLGTVPQALRQRLIQGAEGNPFYMEELVNMLIDRGAIVVEGDSWRLAEAPLDESTIPRTLTGVVQARLDELAPQEAQALQWAAVVGHVFWEDALRALGQADTGCLDLLVQRQFITTRPEGTLAGQREYAFRHHLLHQACYARVLKRVKVPAHARVAAWLRALPGQPQHDLIAQHHERGGQPLQAALAWAAAADVARQRHAYPAAADQARRALELTPDEDLRARFALHTLREAVLNQMAERALQRQEIETLVQLAERLGSAEARGDVARAQAGYAFRTGQAAEAVRLAELALQLHPQPSEAACRDGHQRAAALAHLGRLPEARDQAEASLEMARQTGQRGMESVLYNELATMAVSQGEVGLAGNYLHRALAIDRAIGHVANEAGVLANLGYLEMSTGGYDAARTSFEQARDSFRKIGQPDREGLVMVNLGIVALNCGDATGAAEHARRARQLLARTRARRTEAEALRLLGQSLLAQGDAPGAGAVLADAWEMFTSLGFVHLAMETLASRAEAALACGDHAAAHLHCSQVLASWTDEGALDGMEEPLRVALTCWRVLHALADPRAEDTRRRGRDLLAARARRIAERPLRRRFLMQVPFHRAWLRSSAAHAPAMAGVR